MIAFIGSVFSPYYAWARRRGRGDPLNHCSVNVVLTGAGGNRWCMTERGRSRLRRDQRSLAIGPSSLDWDGTVLTIRLDETTMPVPSRVSGTIRVHPHALTERSFTLDASGRHRWWPISPRSRVEVDLDRPGLRWTGTGYLDTNAGDEALEDAFSQWDWCRADLGDGAAILYNVDRRAAPPLALSLRIDPAGAVEMDDPLPPARLPATKWWRIPRATRADPGHAVTVRETLVDAPFYARSVLETSIGSRPATAVHESLSLDRFRMPWVQALLPFRMPRLP
ncbi:carotenoid 1,2-hydratase [Skermanella mucosa]|uniref:carotenoid 1,2-hydratase n=1 Tax=Skermanella mucosa TaxID=1789672 RepID=UPI001E4650A8|nr:carotenoid 1,2-hydratase [Skermanella mucosa]UEM22844.1 carotenoid 1,2-hydratase [Skermanella mucosa]